MYISIRYGSGEGGSFAESSLIDDSLNGNPRTAEALATRPEERPTSSQACSISASSVEDDAIVGKYVIRTARRLKLLSVRAAIIQTVCAVCNISRKLSAIVVVCDTFVRTVARVGHRSLLFLKFTVSMFASYDRCTARAQRIGAIDAQRCFICFCATIICIMQAYVQSLLCIRCNPKIPHYCITEAIVTSTISLYPVHNPMYG